jgi:hypothetical protein
LHAADALTLPLYLAQNRPHDFTKTLLLGHSKIESTVRYLGIEIDDAIEIAEKIDSEVPGQSCRALPSLETVKLRQQRS